MQRSPAGGGAPGGLRGRGDECAVLDALLDDVRSGASRSVILTGEAGIGKTALLEYLIASAGDLTVLRAAGAESEMELAYASLHQLCAPLLDRLEKLPLPQRQALETVFGLSAGAPPDRFLVGLGALSLLSEVAEERPLLCILDDAQWLDQTSALTLTFVARRLMAERMGIVFAAREPSGELAHLPKLQLHGLRNDDARVLLHTASRVGLDDQISERILAETRGNPLALLELPRGLTATELAGGFGLLEARGLSGRIEEGFVRRLEPLPDDTRVLLLAAAAEPLGDPLLLWRAVERLGIAPMAAAAAQADGLLTIGDRVTFRHPLVRSAIYKSASPNDRSTVHLALAEVTDRDVDPDRRAWHLAGAATGPDEQIAAELERSAGRAQARGGVAAAAAFLERSVALTLEAGRRAARALSAAQAHVQAGALDEAQRLLTSAEAGQLTELGRARVDLLRGQIAFAMRPSGEASELLLKAATRLEPLDLALARETYLDAWGAALVAGRVARVGTLEEVSRAALRAPGLTSGPRPMDLLLDGWALVVTEGGKAGAPKLSRATRMFAAGEIPVAEALPSGWFAQFTAACLWDLESFDVLGHRLLQSARDAGFLVEQHLLLSGLGYLAVWCGDFATAASLIAESDAIAEATRTDLSRFLALLFAGFRGRKADISGLIEVERKHASAAGQGTAVDHCHWVSAVLYNGLGRYDLALAKAQCVSEQQPGLGIRAWARIELVEAAARIGEPRFAREALEGLAEATSVSDSNWGLGVLARSRALLSEGADAEASYREAIDRLSRTRLRPELARAQLVYGEWLRRENRRLDAREQLLAAYDLFTAIGMEAFAERARGERLATGERVRRQTVETRDDLTAQERQIGQLARGGLSNPEIGARLFLSRRTVEWHLRNVFIKLGISSRGELASVLPTTEPEMLSG